MNICSLYDPCPNEWFKTVGLGTHSVFLFVLFCFQFCYSSPKRIIAQDGVGCLTLCVSFPFLSSSHLSFILLSFLNVEWLPKPRWWDLGLRIIKKNKYKLIYAAMLEN